MTTDPRVLPGLHIHEHGTVTVPPAVSAVLFTDTNVMAVFQGRGRDWDPVVRAVVSALLGVGRSTSATTSANASAAVQAEHDAEELTLSGTPSSGRGGMSVAAAAELIGISCSGTRLACREGRLAAELVGSTWIVDAVDAQRFARERKERFAA